MFFEYDTEEEAIEAVSDLTALGYIVTGIFPEHGEWLVYVMQFNR